MELISEVATSVVLLVFGGLGIASITRRMDRLETRLDAQPTRAEFDALGAHLDQQFGGLVGRIDRLEGRFDDLASENRAMRADLTQIALAVGARSRPQTG